jgi:hypothetical protein
MSDKLIAVFQAKQALNKFLNENPHLKPMQKQIDEMLQGAGSQHNRMVLLGQKMKDNQDKLVQELNKFTVLVSRVVEHLKNLDKNSNT